MPISVNWGESIFAEENKKTVMLKCILLNITLWLRYYLLIPIDSSIHGLSYLSGLCYIATVLESTGSHNI